MNTESTTDADRRCLSRLVRCECSMATRMLGDGCRYCNPELGAELKWNSEADDFNQWDSLGGDEKAELIVAFILANVPDQTPAALDSANTTDSSSRLSASVLFALCLGVFATLTTSGTAKPATEVSHFPALGGKVCCSNRSVPEGLDHLQLLDKEVVERFGVRPVSLALHQAWSPSAILIKPVLPVSNSGFESQRSQVTSISSVNVRAVPFCISDTLPPAIEKQGNSAYNSGTKHASTGSDDRDTLYVFLFLWGHDWWVLALWWGLMAFAAWFFADMIYGAIYEWRYFRGDFDTKANEPIRHAASDSKKP